MKRSERKLRKILSLDRKWYHRPIDFYLDRPALSDLALSIFTVGIYEALCRGVGRPFLFEKSDLSDLLNELISSSLSAGGFVLAALAILAGIKQGVPEVKSGERPRNGKEYFYNSIGYKNVIQMYGVACLMFIAGFLYFSFLRGTFAYFTPYHMLLAVIFGMSLITFLFLRCITVLWAVIRI